MSATATTSIVIKMQFAQILLHHLNAHVRRDTLEMDLFVPKLRQIIVPLLLVFPWGFSSS